MTTTVEQYLISSRVPYTLHAHPRIVTFADARQVLPFKPDQMVKGLAFELVEQRIAIVALRAQDRADYKKVADALSLRRQDLHPADPEDVLNILGMEVGGIAPIPVPGSVVLVDHAVLGPETIYCGSGRATATIELTTADYAGLPLHCIGTFSKATVA